MCNRSSGVPHAHCRAASTLSRACVDVRVQAIIATAAPIMRRAGVTTDDGKSGRRSEGRTNDLAWLRHDENETISAVVGRVANLVGLPMENAEKLQVIHYQEGQRYLPHDRVSCSSHSPYGCDNETDPQSTTSLFVLLLIR